VLAGEHELRARKLRRQVAETRIRRWIPCPRSTRELLGLLAKLLEIHHDLLPREPAVRGVGQEEDRLVLQVVPDEVGSALPADRMRPRSAPGTLYVATSLVTFRAMLEQLRQAAEALNRGDPEPLAALFAEDAEWRDVPHGHLWWKRTHPDAAPRLVADGRAQERFQVITLRDGKIADMQGCASRRQAERFAHHQASTSA